MPLFAIVRFLSSLVSLAILATAGYLVWSWFDGQVVVDGLGREDIVREDWRLWSGLALLALSLAGRFVVLLILARPSDRLERFERGQGRPLTMQDGSNLYVEECGDADAPAIVFTHGQGLDSTVWARARRSLRQRFHVVLWDLPGLGRSAGSANADYSVPAAASALRDVIKRTSKSPAVLVGHSFGGMAIQELAKLDPDFFRANVAGVVLLHTTYANPLHTMLFAKLATSLQRPLIEPLTRLSTALEPLVWLNIWQSYLSGAAHIANRIQFGPAVTRRQLEHTTLLACTSRPSVIDRRNLAMFRWSGLAPQMLAAPVLVIGGAIDIVTKAEASSHISRAAPTATLQLAPGANHLGPIERADEYNRAIADFARELIANPKGGLEEEADPFADAAMNSRPPSDRSGYDGRGDILH